MADETLLSSADNTNGANTQVQTQESQQQQQNTTQNQTTAQTQQPDGNTLLSQNQQQEENQSQQKEQQPSQQAPEKYEDFKIAEGLQSDKALIDRALPLFKEANLTQEQAQKFVDFQNEFVKNQQAAQQAEFEKMYDGWKNDTIKQQGPNYKEALGIAAKPLDAVPEGKEFRKLLEDTRLGNHPVVVNFLKALGSTMTEDNFHAPSQQNSGGKKSLADRMFGEVKGSE
jgi:hypothetical protein